MILSAIDGFAERIRQTLGKSRVLLHARNSNVAIKYLTMHTSRVVSILDRDKI